MMRRLIRNPTRRPCRRRSRTILTEERKSPSPHPSTSIGSRRYHGGDSAARSQLHGDAPSTARLASPLDAPPSSRGFEAEGISARRLSSEAIRALPHRVNGDFFGASYAGQDATTIPVPSGVRGRVAPPLILPLSSRGFEIRGVSSRQLSSEAVQALALSPRGANAFFGSSADDGGEDVARNPLLNDVRDGRSKNADLPADAFLDLFRAISTLHQQPSAPADPSAPDESIAGEKESSDLMGDEIDIDDAASSASGETPQKIPPKASASDADRGKHTLRCRLGEALKKNPHSAGGCERVLDIFDEARRSPHEPLEDWQVLEIFYFLVEGGDLVAAHDVLKHHATRCREHGRLVPLNAYQKLVHGLHSVELRWRGAPPRRRDADPGTTVPMTLEELRDLVEDVARHVREVHSEGTAMVYQYLLLPELVAALASHGHPHVNSCAKPIVEHILDEDFPQLNPELFEYVLVRATRRNTGPNFLPHHRVLSYLVSNGYRPRPKTVINLLYCNHPYTDTYATQEILSVVHKLVQPENESAPSAAEDYRIDLGTLSAISMASARRNIDLNLLVWDIMDFFGYSPTESMFEDIVMSFAAMKQDNNMYSALVDMERNGFAPSPGLLRYVASKVSFTQKRLEHSSRVLAWRGNQHMRSTPTMNALMLAYGMSGDISSAFLYYEDLPRFGLKPDANTFCFLMEILYSDTKSRFPYQADKPPEFDPQDIEDVVGAAQIILDAMEEAGITKTKLFYHEHIRVLCALGLLDDAKLVLEEAISSGTPLPTGSLVMLTNRFADCGEFDKAFAVAEAAEAAGCGKLPRLEGRIRNTEKRFIERQSNLIL